MAGLSQVQRDAFTALRTNVKNMLQTTRYPIPSGYHDGEREYVTHGSVTWSGWEFSGKEGLSNKNINDVTQEEFKEFVEFYYTFQTFQWAAANFVGERADIWELSKRIVGDASLDIAGPLYDALNSQLTDFGYALALSKWRNNCLYNASWNAVFKPFYNDSLTYIQENRSEVYPDVPFSYEPRSAPGFEALVADFSNNDNSDNDDGALNLERQRKFIEGRVNENLYDNINKEEANNPFWLSQNSRGQTIAYQASPIKVLPLHYFVEVHLGASDSVEAFIETQTSLLVQAITTSPFAIDADSINLTEWSQDDDKAILVGCSC